MSTVLSACLVTTPICPHYSPEIAHWGQCHPLFAFSICMFLPTTSLSSSKFASMSSSIRILLIIFSLGINDWLMQITAISVFLTLLLSPSSSIFNYLLGISRHLLWSVPYTANFLSPTLACSFSFISLLGCRHRHPSTQMPAAEILKSALTLLSGQLCTTSALVFSLRLVLAPTCSLSLSLPKFWLSRGWSK